MGNANMSRGRGPDYRPRAPARASPAPGRRLQPPEGESGGYDPRNLEHGILALLSFLGHSYKRGTISDASYREAASASLRKLNQIRGSRPQEGEETYPEQEPETKLEKLDKSRQDLEAMLSFLEDSYTEGSISEESYRELKAENSKRLSRVLGLIRQSESGDQADFQDAPEPLRPRRRPSYEETDAEEPEDYPAPRMPEAELPVRAAPRLKPQDTLSLYDDLNESFDSEAVLDQTQDIMRELNVKNQDYPPEPPARQRRSASRPDSFEADAPAAAPAPSGEKKTPDAQAGSFLNKLGGMFKKDAPAGSAPAASGATGQAAAAAAASKDASNVPFIEGPGGTKMYGSGTEDDPYRPTPEKPVAQVTAAAAEEKPLIDVGDEEGGGASSAAMGKIVLELEKMKVKVDGLGEMRNSIEERMGHIQESVGELRQMLFERDAASKENEAKTAKFIDLVTELDPQHLIKELEKRDKVLNDFNMRVEKAETLGGDLAHNFTQIKELLEGIGSLKNISDVNKDIAEKIGKIDRTVSKADRLAEEIGRVYVDLNRRLGDFNAYKGKQDLLAESVKDLVQLVEANGAKFEELATKNDQADLKRQLEELSLKVQEVEAKEALYEEGRDLPHHLKELKKQKESVDLVLSMNEEEYFDRAISREDYEKVRQANVKKLQEIEKLMQAEFVKLQGERVRSGRQVERIAESLERAAAEAAVPASPELVPAAASLPPSAVPSSPASLAPSSSAKASPEVPQGDGEDDGPAQSDEPEGEEEEGQDTSEELPAFSATLAQAKSASKAAKKASQETASEPAGAASASEASKIGASSALPENLSEEALDDLQKQLEAHAQEQVQKVSANRQKQLGGLLSQAIGGLVGNLRKKPGVLSSKPLRLAQKETQAPAGSSTPQPSQVSSTSAQTSPSSAGQSSSPAPLPAKALTPPTVSPSSPQKRPFTTWREKRAAEAGPAPASMERQAKAVASVRAEEPEAARQAAADLAAPENASNAENPAQPAPSFAPAAVAAPVELSTEEALAARVRSLKAMRAQYLEREAPVQEKHARTLLRSVRKTVLHRAGKTPHKITAKTASRSRKTNARRVPSKPGRRSKR